MLSLFGIDPSPQADAALISLAGVVLTVGIAVLGWLANQQRERAGASRMRRLQRRDLLLALRSDIQPVWVDLYTQGTLEAKLDRVKEAFEEHGGAGAAYTPFVTRIAGTLFDTRLVQDIDVLREGEIEPIVKFYHQIRTINQMADDMRTDRYAALCLQRKRNVLEAMFRLENEAVELAETALYKLEDILGIEDSEEEERRTKSLRATIDRRRADQ